MGTMAQLTGVTGAFELGDARPWLASWPLPDGFGLVAYYLGKGTSPLEVAVAEAAQRPSQPDVRRLWKQRQADRTCPVLLVVLQREKSKTTATVCGPEGDPALVLRDLDPQLVESIAKATLAGAAWPCQCRHHPEPVKPRAAWPPRTGGAALERWHDGCACGGWWQMVAKLPDGHGAQRGTVQKSAANKWRERRGSNPRPPA